jgi:hypothetical protein
MRSAKPKVLDRYTSVSERCGDGLVSWEWNRKGQTMIDDQPTGPADQIIHFDLRLDRRTLSDLQAIAAEHSCGVGGTIRHFIKTSIAQAKAKATERQTT